MCMSNAHYGRCGHKHRRRHARKWWKNHYAMTWAYPPVKVEEMDDRYEILLYAAGYAKSDFQIAVKDNTLTIKVEKTEGSDQRSFFRGHNDFVPGSFERQFRLNEKINKAGISAQFEEGVLRLILPKLEGHETERHQIDVE